MTRLLLSLFALPVLAAPALAQSFEWIEPAPTFTDSVTLGVSGDGQVAFGYCLRDFQQGPAVAFKWTREGGYVGMSQLNPDISAFPTSASYDGSVLAGHSFRSHFPAASTSHPVRWGPGSYSAPAPIGSIPMSLELRPGPGRWIVSGDGQAIVGLADATCGSTGCTYSFFRWTAATGNEPIQLPGMVVAVNQDASVILGNRAISMSSNSVYRWTPQTGAIDIQPNAVLLAANEDCTVLVLQNGADTYRWSAAQGLLDLNRVGGHLPVPWASQARGVSADGGVIVGAITRQLAAEGGFIWTPQLGYANLADLMPRMGLNDPASLIECSGVSSDGRTIVGTGWSGGRSRAFVLTIPRCSSADFNNDGDSGTDADIEAFFACLAGDCCFTCWWRNADIDSDGDSGTDADIEAFFRVLAGNPC